MNILDLVNYIDQNGIALDDDGNEVRDEEGAVILVSESERSNYTVIERNYFWD